MGRAFGPAILTRFPRLAPTVARAHEIVERLPNTAVVGVRFLYGMRAVGPAVIGAGRIALTRFVVLDAIAAALWSFSWISAGYLLGEAVTQLLEGFAQVGRWLLFGAIGVLAILVFALLLRRRSAAKRLNGPSRTN